MVIVILIVLGVCFGSFVNALVWRIHEQESSKKKAADRKLSIIHGRSMCPSCKHELAAKDLLPIVSWLWLRGKCRYCHNPIQDTPLAELLTPALFLLSYIAWPYGFNVEGWVLFGFWLVLLVGLVALVIYDFRWYLLPNRIVIPLIWLVFTQILVQLIFFEGGWSLITGAFWGVLFGAGFFWLLFQLSDGKWIGGGDIKLGVVYGLLLGGPVNSMLCIFLASLLGTAIGIPMIVNKRLNRKSLLPFGPFLICSLIIVYLFGPDLVEWYKNLIGL